MVKGISDSTASFEAHQIDHQMLVDRLQNEIHDLQIELATSNEHGDLLQEHLYRLSTSLKEEVRERQTAEEKLQKILDAVSREKCDLEILVQILMDQGDIAAEEGEQARIDGLTQVANRRRFDEYLFDEWRRHARLMQPISLVLCDVDHFKLFNDHYGHPAGDECLKAVAMAISKCFRTGDLVARYGGEEFALVLPHTNREGALSVAERVQASVRALAFEHEISPVCGYVTLSVGVGCKEPQRELAGGISTLISEADRNLYIAKQQGRNRVSHRSLED